MTEALEGGCACGAVRYRLEDVPMVVHCCHCTWCQRETGSAFAINAVIERDRVTLLSGEPEAVMTPSESGRGQEIFRCPSCRVAVWSRYTSPKAAFVRVGTLDERAAVVPDVHIFTRSKLPWVRLPEGAKVYEGFYADPGEVWSPEARARWKAMTSQ